MIELVTILVIVLTPVAVVLVLWLRARQAARATRDDLARFVRTSRFEGTFEPEIALRGEADGAPCFVSADVFSAGARCLRVRVLSGEASGYREAPTRTAATALVIARGAAVPGDRITGLAEVGSGDALFDGSFRCFAAPGTQAPWRDPILREALLAGAGFLNCAEHGPLESSVTFSTFQSHGAFLGRAVALASALTGPERAARRHAELAQPFQREPLPETTRVKWAVGRAASVYIGGLLLMAPFMFLPPVLAVAESIVCRRGEHMQMVGNGRGGSYACVGPHGLHLESTWPFLLALALGIAVSLLGFEAVRLFVGARRNNA